MILKHRVCINIADSNGAREPVIRGETISLRTRLLNWLLGGKEEVLVLRPGRSVTSVEIFQDADNITEYGKVTRQMDQAKSKGG